jgi:hypoxanthine phosphoribosyltransferase
MPEQKSAATSPQMTADKARKVWQRASCLYDAEALASALDSMAEAVTADLEHSNPLLLCVMTGAFVTTSELARRLAFPLEVDYLHASRYGDKLSGDQLHWIALPRTALAGRHVLIVDDIFDQGATLMSIAGYCREQGAASVRSAVLVDKQHERKLTSERPDYIGLEVPDYYVFGFGMDYRGYLRNANGLYAASPEDC